MTDLATTSKPVRIRLRRAFESRKYPGFVFPADRDVTGLRDEVGFVIFHPDDVTKVVRISFTQIETADGRPLKFLC